MKILNLAFRVSLSANVVFILWALGERQRSQRIRAYEAGEVAHLNNVRENLENLRKLIHDQALHAISNNDQMDAFLEEFGEDLD